MCDGPTALQCFWLVPGSWETLRFADQCEERKTQEAEKEEEESD